MDNTNTDDFITVWRVKAGQKFTLELMGNRTVTVDWGDGSELTRVTFTDKDKADPALYKHPHSDETLVRHEYATTGDVEVRVSNGVERCTFLSVDHDASKEHLLDIKQWGAAIWDCVGLMFTHASNLTMSATDTPDLSNVSYLDHMFTDCPKFNSNIAHWDVSSVDRKTNMFGDDVSFSDYCEQYRAKRDKAMMDAMLCDNCE